MPIPPREREKSHLVWLHFYNIYSLIIANAILRKCQREREKILQHHKGTKATRRDFGARAWDADDCYAIRKELKMKNSAFGIWKCEWRRSMSDDKKKHENWLENDAIFREFRQRSSSWEIWSFLIANLDVKRILMKFLDSFWYFNFRF